MRRLPLKEFKAFKMAIAGKCSRRADGKNDGQKSWVLAWHQTLLEAGTDIPGASKNLKGALKAKVCCFWELSPFKGRV